MEKQNFDGFLICPGFSKKQNNQFKQLFANDNLIHIPKNNRYLQLRKLSEIGNNFILDVYVDKELMGHFAVHKIEPHLLSMQTFKIINQQAETLFKEETIYGIKDKEGIDRINHSLLSGFGDFENYATVTSKAAALWYKIATNQFFLNGNKRTALLSAIYFLRTNFYKFNSTNGNEMYELSVNAASGLMKNYKPIEKYILENVTLDYQNMGNALNATPYNIKQKISFKNDRI